MGLPTQDLKEPTKFIKLGVDVKKIINNCLRLDWSPEQVCGWLDANNIIKLHHESIYPQIQK